ncbi:hypothetical protein A3J23_02940 [Candidatus Peregrinibacteria bacterium RIFCSPLOWO2_02_FULL_48_14]|nr:MAG: hypothetical protein A3J23_02940 [Candidatus Peregrinibacteria bacterium RIFCSPLOWO2_02_FULL_48_14]
MKKFNIFPYLFIFLATFFALQLWQKGTTEDPVLSAGDIGVEAVKDEYAIGKDIKITVQNNLEEVLEIPVRCEGETLLPAFNVYRFTNGSFLGVSDGMQAACSAGKITTVEPGDKKTISLLPFSYSYFGEIGRYKVALELPSGIFESPEFEIEEPGVLTKFWRMLIYQPILNVLIALIIYLPGHYLGLAVIALTLIIRTILLVPSQKAIKAQMRMQEVQPKLEELKKKYADDQARLAQETMLLWKTHKVNPLSSCLPMLIQFPILIALFYVINGGLSPDRSVFIYDFLPNFSLSDINPAFLGFNLLENDFIVFPLVVGGLQFLQMQLMMTKKKKKTAAVAALPKEMETANKMMKYVMPIMIAVFTAQLPAAVGLYWGTSTFYGIVQQVVVNSGGDAGASSKDDVQVRVLSGPKGSKQ